MDDYGRFLSLNLSQAMFFMVMVALVVVLWRFRVWVRPDIMIPFVIILAGWALREGGVSICGAAGWDKSCLELNGYGKAGMFIGITAFVRGVSWDRCGEVGWMMFLLGSLGWAAIF